MYIHVYTMIIETTNIEGKTTKFNIKAINITKGKITESGNSYHVLIKKKDAEEYDKRKPIGILFFEWDGGIIE